MLFLDSWVSMALGLYQEVEEGGRVVMELQNYSFSRGFGSFGQVLVEDGANVPYYISSPSAESLTAVVVEKEKEESNTCQLGFVVAAFHATSSFCLCHKSLSACF